ncbi:MAG: FIST N-terminal domain-containing protein [Bdellovibrionales bacterium]
MSLFTSSHFASASAIGSDWREVSKAVLEHLEAVKTDGVDFNLGFLYLTDALSDDAESILNLFKSVLGVDHWVGANGIGVVSTGESHIDKPAISAMIGCFDPDSFHLFPANHLNGDALKDHMSDWLKDHDPMLVIAHGDPTAEEDPANTLKSLNDVIPGFIVGGLSSSRNTQVQIANDINNNGVSGVAFSNSVQVMSALSQGCEPIGSTHVITKCDEHTILELDHKKALHVFERDLRDMALKKIGEDPDQILIDPLDIESKDDLPPNFQSLMSGEMHVAFPVSQSDQNDFLVRNIMRVDQDEGSIMVAQYLTNHESITFVHRDDNTVQEDLSKTLVKLRKRASDASGQFKPKGALYFSCAGRAMAEFEGRADSEMRLIHDIIGDVPLCGFYAGGEISNARLYGYTGILTLFL